MAIIPLRSPRYEVLLAPTNAVSAKLELTIASTLRYTKVKESISIVTIKNIVHGLQLSEFL